MKKNKLMRLASGLLVGTLLTTCAISGTFAKYTTQDAGEDSARVAKWGVELQIVGTLYGENYLADDNTVTSKDDDTSISVESDGKTSVKSSNTVDSATSYNVVAPGTKSGEVFSIKLNGTPEVDTHITGEITSENVYLQKGYYGRIVKVDIPVTSENLNDLIAAEERENGKLMYAVTDGYAVATRNMVLNGQTFYTLEDYVYVADDYYPVVYKSTGKADGNDSSDSLAAIAKYIANSLETDTANNEITDANTSKYMTKFTIDKDYPTNYNLSDLKLSKESIQWDWAFGGTEKGDLATENDKADTVLGNLIDNGESIVRCDTETGTYTYPVDGTHYNLETGLAIDLTVTQID